MEIFIQFIKEFFTKARLLLLKSPPIKEFSLGAFVNEVDNRDIPYSAVAGIAGPLPAHIEVPGFLTATRLQQGGLGTCVAHALEFIRRVDDNIVHSRRVPYVLTRNALGWTEASGQGLPQREAAKTFTIIGTPKDTGLDDNTLLHKDYTALVVTPEMKIDANIYRYGGFAFPQINVEAIKQALANGKLVAVTIAIDWMALDQDGTFHTPKKVYGYHEVVIGQSDDVTGKFRFANWWGQWGTNGDGFIPYSELNAIVFDAIVFTDIPEDLKVRASQTQFIFNNDMKIGTNSADNAQLQTRLASYGVYTGAIDRSFGPKTLQAVKDYQRFKGIPQTGFAGPMTRKALNDDAGIGSGVTKSKMDLWIEAGTQMEGALPARNNPGNLRYVGQHFAINDRGFCKFDTLAHGYDAFRNLLVSACSGTFKAYNPNGSLYDFYNVYAPSSDGNDPKHYAEFVAKHIGVDPNVQIKTLLV